jgi:putative oxidoreductase
MKYLEILLCFTLGVVFVASSVPKLCHPRGFILVVLESRVLYPPIARLYGWMLPPLELFIALLLLSGTMVPIAASIAALFIISFIVAVSINIARGRDLDCHCFGTKIRRRTGCALILQDCLLLGIAVAIVLVVPIQPMLESWSIFRVIGFWNKDSFMPFLVSLGLTGGIALLLRSWKSRDSWSMKTRYLGQSGTDVKHS